MRKSVKKIVSILLIISVVLGISTVAFAKTADDNGAVLKPTISVSTDKEKYNWGTI